MRQLILLAAALAGAASAHASTWSFSYTGATSADAPFTLDTLDGQFAASDLDGNGFIDRGEVQWLDFFGYRMAPAADMGQPGMPPGSAMSELTSFAFDPATDALGFTGHAGSWQDAYVKSDTALLYETGIGNFTFDLSNAQLQVHSLDGTAVLQAQPLPVPEPGTWLLLAAGLAAVGWRGLRVTRRAERASA